MRASGSSRRRGPVVPRAGLVLALTLLLAVGSVVWGGSDSARAEGPRDFGPVFHTQTNGAIAITGNSLLSCGRSAECTAALSGTASANTDNNHWRMAPLDRDADPSTRASSSANLALPAGAAILFAGLFWGANEPSPPAGDPAELTFKVPGGDYRTVRAERHDRMPSGQGTSSYLDVTSAVRAAGNGTYWAADIAAQPGHDDFGAWSLVVAYTDPGAPLRDLTVFNGYQQITQNDGGASKLVDIELSGFLTPPRGPVNARFGVVAYEGDRGLSGDFFEVNGHRLGDAISKPDNFFVGSVSADGKTLTDRDLPTVNSLGLDAKVVDAPGVLPNDATSAKLTLGTEGDVYQAVALTTQIDLFAPAIKGTKSVRNLSGDDGDVKPGDTLQYTVDFANTGDDDATGAVLTDELPPNTSFVPGSLRVTGGGNEGTKTDRSGDDQAEYDAATRTITARLGAGATDSAGGRVGADGKVSVAYRVTVDPGATGTTLTNVAALGYRAETIDRSFTATTPPVETPVGRGSELVITKQSWGSFGSRDRKPIAGKTSHYRLTVRNDGPAPARDVQVRDVLPDSFSEVTAQPSAGSCEVNGRTVDCDLGELRTGDSVQITVTGTLAAGAAGELRNTATATSPDDPTPATDTVETTILTQADLALTKTAEAVPGRAGGTIDYLLTVRNRGPSTARDVTITDPVPAPLTVDTVITSSGGCDRIGRTVTCRVDRIEPGEVVTVRVSATVPPTRPAELANTATVSSETPELDPSDNTSIHTLTRSPQADLSVIKRADRPEVVAGERISYEVIVHNAGAADATGLTLTDRLPEAILAAEVRDSENSCRIADHSVTCARDSLPSGDSFTIMISGDLATDTPAGPLVNTATITADDSDPTESDNTSTSTVEVRHAADLALTKSGPETVAAGEEIAYELKVTNQGPSVADEVVVADALPAGVRFTGGFSGYGDCEPVADVSPTVLRCPLGRLAAGRSRLITVFGVVDPGQPAGPMINTAAVWSPTPDHDQENNAASVTTDVIRVQPTADLELTKTAVVVSLRPGERVTYRLTAMNHGPDPASETMITDTFPAGLTVIGGRTEDADCNLRGSELGCMITELAPGASAVVEVVAELGPDYAGESIANTAVVNSETSDPDQENNTATIVLPVGTEPEPPSPEPPSPEPPSPEPPSPEPPSPEPPSPEPPSPQPPTPTVSMSEPPESPFPKGPSASPRDPNGSEDQLDASSLDQLPGTGGPAGIGIIFALTGLVLLGAGFLVVARLRRR